MCGTFHHLMVGSCHLSNQEFLADFGVAKVNHLSLHFRSPSSCIREKQLIFTFSCNELEKPHTNTIRHTRRLELTCENFLLVVGVLAPLAVKVDAVAEKEGASEAQSTQRHEPSATHCRSLLHMGGRYTGSARRSV